MGINIINSVPEDKSFWLADGRKVTSLKELHNALKDISYEIFSHHVNENKNDFYNWVKDVYRNKELADDLLECITKEAVIFCLESRLSQVENLTLLRQMPKQNIMENISETRFIINDLPRKNILEKVDRKQIRKPLITLLNPSIFKKKVVKTVVPDKKIKKKMTIRAKTQNENFNKDQIKKIKAENPDSIIKKLKEVYKIE